MIARMERLVVRGADGQRRCQHRAGLRCQCELVAPGVVAVVRDPDPLVLGGDDAVVDLPGQVEPEGGADRNPQQEDQSEQACRRSRRAASRGPPGVGEGAQARSSTTPAFVGRVAAGRTNFQPTECASEPRRRRAAPPCGLAGRPLTFSRDPRRPFDRPHRPRRRRPQGLHPRDGRRGRRQRTLRPSDPHALSARAERLSAHRARQVDLPELRHRARVRRPVQPPLRRHEPVHRGHQVRRGDQERRPLARLRVGRGAATRATTSSSCTSSPSCWSRRARRTSTRRARRRSARAAAR